MSYYIYTNYLNSDDESFYQTMWNSQLSITTALASAIQIYF